MPESHDGYLIRSNRELSIHHERVSSFPEAWTVPVTHAQPCFLRLTDTSVPSATWNP
jgi:hypothetical protein